MSFEIAGTETRPGVIVVTFKDGHELVVCDNHSGFFGNAVAIESIELRFDGENVLSYFSPYQSVNNRSPFGFTRADPAYTLTRFLGYLEATVSHYRKQGLTDAWHILSLADRDITDIRAGKWPL